jgi:hypothetical protein
MTATWAVLTVKKLPRTKERRITAKITIGIKNKRSICVLRCLPEPATANCTGLPFRRSYRLRIPK